mgnify:FL=1
MKRLRESLRPLLRLLGDESGQAISEYSIITASLLVGGTAAVVTFLPEAIKAYDAYVRGYYLVLGLPFP